MGKQMYLLELEKTNNSNKKEVNKTPFLNGGHEETRTPTLAH